MRGPTCVRLGSVLAFASVARLAAVHELVALAILNWEPQSKIQFSLKI